MHAAGGHPHRLRRHDLATRRWWPGRWARSRRRLRRAHLRLPRPHDDRGHGRGARRSSARATGSPSTASPARSSRASSTPRPPRSSRCSSRRTWTPEDAPLYQQYAKLIGWADKAPQAQGPHQRRPARPGRDRRRLRRRGHRPVPHRAHVLRRGQDRPDARDDRRRERGGPPRGAGQAAARSSGRTSPASSRRWTARPVTIRTIDPPLHEFLPHDEAGIADLAARHRHARSEHVKARIAELHESNPMLGHRGCRLGITYPEITEMQARAIFEAACDVAEEGVDGAARGHDPAGRRPRRSSTTRRRSSAAWRPRSSRSRGRRCRTWSAP